MNERQKYLFDLQGYLVMEDVLSEADCDLAIAKTKERAHPMEKTPDGYDANGTWHSAAGLYEAGEPFLKLIDHPLHHRCADGDHWLAPALRELLQLCAPQGLSAL